MIYHLPHRTAMVNPESKLNKNTNIAQLFRYRCSFLQMSTKSAKMGLGCDRQLSWWRNVNREVWTERVVLRHFTQGMRLNISSVIGKIYLVRGKKLIAYFEILLLLMNFMPCCFASEGFWVLATNDHLNSKPHVKGEQFLLSNNRVYSGWSHASTLPFPPKP